MPHTITIPPTTTIILFRPMNSSSNLNTLPIPCSSFIFLSRDFRPINKRLSTKLLCILELVLRVRTRNGGFDIRCPAMTVPVAVAVYVVVAAVAVVLGSGAVVGGEEAWESLLDEGSESGETGADDCDVAFDCAPCCGAGVVVFCFWVSGWCL